MRSAVEVARHVADTLEAAGVPYAIGGALALGVWGFPRATNDVDVDVFVEAGALEPVLAVLARSGLQIDVPAALASARDRGDCRAYMDGLRVDLFVMSIPFYESARERLRRAPLQERPGWFLAAEDLALFTLLFLRTKDLLDVERMVAFLGGTSIGTTCAAGSSSSLASTIVGSPAGMRCWPRFPSRDGGVAGVRKAPFTRPGQ